MRFGITVTSGMRPKLLRIRFLAVTSCAMVYLLPLRRLAGPEPGERVVRGARIDAAAPARGGSGRMQPERERQRPPTFRAAAAVPWRGRGGRRSYLISTEAPAASSCAFSFAASSFETASFTGFGAPST